MVWNYTTPTEDDGDSGYVDASSDFSSDYSSGASYYSMSALGSSHYVSPFINHTSSLYDSSDSLYTTKGYSLYNPAPEDGDLPDMVDDDQAEPSDLESVKTFIKSSGHEDIREALFQFIQADPQGPEKFLQFLNKVAWPVTVRVRFIVLTLIT